jgi:DNA-binding beta-propeller fold protein YncE
MIRYLFAITICSLLVSSCGPARHQQSTETNSILNLQTIAVIGPQIIDAGSLRSPRDVAVNQLGEIYIADYGNDRVVKLDSTGAFIKEVGGFGAGDYVMSGPLDIAIDQISNVYVVDSGNRRVVRFDRFLNFISSETGYKNDPDVSFIRPLSIDITGRGDILLGDEGLGACYKLDQFFGYILDFGGRDEYQSIVQPSAIAYDTRNSKIYVVDAHSSHALIYDDFGLLLQVFGDDVLDKPSAITIAPKTGIWVGDENTGMIYCFNFRGHEIFRWNGYGAFSLQSPSGLFWDNNTGKLYIVDSQASRVLITSPLTGN